MSRVYKRILSLFGLAFVVAITAIAYGLPPAGEDVSAQSSDVVVGVRIINVGEIGISEPADGTVYYDCNNNVVAVNYTDIAILSVRLTAPDGTVTEIYSFNTSGVNQTGSATIPLETFLSTYGTYAVEVDGYNAGGAYISGVSVSFQFHAITVEPSPDRTKDVRVYFGPATCKLNLRVFPESNTTGTPLIEYLVEDLSTFPGYPVFADIEIPGFSELDGNQEYTVVVTALDCAGSPLEDAEVDLAGIGDLGPPSTGVISIFGLGLSRTNFLMGGLVVVFVVSLTLLFLRRDKKSTRRR